MGHKTFISFKYEDVAYKNAIKDIPGIDMIDKSLQGSINSENEDYIMDRIRREYLADSTVTIHLIGARSSERLGWAEQRFIKRELQASLYDGTGNTKSGILGIVLPAMHDSVFGGKNQCLSCGATHNIVNISDATAVSEFSYNYYIPALGKCAWADQDRYCVLASWNDFVAQPNIWIDAAFDKRDAPIAAHTKVRP